MNLTQGEVIAQNSRLPHKITPCNRVKLFLSLCQWDNSSSIAILFFSVRLIIMVLVFILIPNCILVYEHTDSKYLSKLKGFCRFSMSGYPKTMYRASILAAIACFIRPFVCANKLSSTNILNFVLSASTTPTWIESFFAWVNVVFGDGSSENWTLSMISLYFRYNPFYLTNDGLNGFVL